MTKRISLHWRRVGLVGLMALGLITLWVSPGGSIVWATPNQDRLRQTIPTLTPTPIPSWIWLGQSTGNPIDYAPSGMPDFDQKQAAWQSTEPAGAWTHCGPLAVADALWWMDSRSEPGSTAPPEVSDGHDLVSSYGAWDDHDPQNVVSLVEDLADRLGTQVSGAQAGTDISGVVPALEAYLAEKDLQDTYQVTSATSPSFDQLAAWVRGGSGVAVLLGFWEWQGDRWTYLGGHYVAIAGVEPANRLVAVSDPFRDAFEAGGVALGRSPVTHPYPHDGDVHNDARYVSQDAYPLLPSEGPGGAWALGGYVASYQDVQNFFEQNVAPDYASYQGTFSGAAITAKLDYAVVVSLPPTSFTLYLPIIVKGAP